MKRLGDIGDTIVEVLIALTVISLVLGGAYVSANRSLNNSRQAQERGEALKIVQSQVERLKFVASGSDDTIFIIPNTFCFDSNNTIHTATNPARVTNPPVDQDNFSLYTSPNCKGQGLGQLFNISIERNTTNPNQFTAFARWDRVGGVGKEEVKLVYRVY